MLTLKDIVAPVTNRLHLVTIIVLASIFAWFRLSGGQVYSTPTEQSPRVPAAYNGGSEAPMGGSSAGPAARSDSGSARTAEEPEPAINPDDFLAELDARRAPAKDQAKPAPAKADTGGTKLDDIERSLGLR